MKRKKNEKPEVAGRTPVIAYVRVSTDQQAEEGYSLEAQSAKLSSYADAYDLEIVALEVDAGLSACSLKRPGLQRALAQLKDGRASGLLVVKLDRLTRNIRDLSDLVETYFKSGDCSLISVGEHIDTASASGRLVINILTVVSQWEREAIGERTSVVMQHMKANGQWTGGWPPFGYAAVDGALVEDAAEQEIIARVRALREQGMSLRRIAAAIPVNPNTGKPYSASQIQRMM